MDYEPSYKEFATIFKALSDETRLRVIDMLSCKEMSACDILSNFTLSQSTLSYHMKILIEAGVVDARREGLWTKYSINDDTFNRIMDFMPELYSWKINASASRLNTARHRKNAAKEKILSVTEKN